MDSTTIYLVIVDLVDLVAVGLLTLYLAMDLNFVGVAVDQTIV